MKRALVTGASGGIGEVIARQLAEDGYEVVVHANTNLAKAEQIASEITADGGKAKAIAFDVTDNDVAREALEALVEEQPVQILVNNAGVTEDMLLAAMTYEQWHKVTSVSLDGFYNVTQPLMMPMLRERWGRIINISSVTGILGNAGQVNYATAKAGLHGATKALAREVAPRNVTVNCVAPGIIETAMTDKVFSEQDISQLIPMKRAGKPEDVANLVSFLASERAGYISGQVIAVSGALV